MLLTPHVLTGMIAGRLSSSVVLSVFLSLVLFFIIEMIPHWDPVEDKSRRTVVIRLADLGISLILFLTLIFFNDFDINILIGGITSFFVYIFFYLIDLFKPKSESLSWIWKFRKRVKYEDKSVWGILIQLSICILGITFLLNLIDIPTWDRIRRNILINVLRLGG